MHSIAPERFRLAHPVIGIIGGMGPGATVDLMQRVIAKTPAQDDADHVHLIVESNPKISSRLAHLLDRTGPDPTPELTRIAGNLERAGADALAMPCNTAHAYAEAIRRAVSIPLLDMVELSADRLQSTAAGTRVGLLASSAVHRIGLYRDALRRRGLDVVEPAHQETVMQLIMSVKRGAVTPQTHAALAAAAAALSSRCDVILVACTELSILSAAIDIPFVDASDVLADAILRVAGVEKLAQSGEVSRSAKYESSRTAPNL